MSTKNRSKLDRFSEFVSSHRLAVLLFAVVIAGILACGTVKMKGEVILEEMLPYAHPYLKIMAQFSEVFGSGGSTVVIAVKVKNGDIFKQSILTKIQKMDKEVAMWEETYRVLTVSLGSRSVKVVKPVGDGEIKVTPLMWPDVPKTTHDMDRLKKDIFSDPIYRGKLVSRDGTATLIISEFKQNISYEQAFELLQQLKSTYTDHETSVHLVGFPVLMGWIYSYKTQIMMVMAISIALMVMVLFLMFQNFIGMAAPILFGLLSTAMGLGFIGWTGINFSPLLYVLAFLVAARMVSHAVQITHRYMEEYHDVQDNIKACYLTTRAMLLPNWAGVATDAAGFFILIFVKIGLMQEVAIFMSFWMMTVAMCGVITPIICSYMPLASASHKWSIRKQKQSLLDKICTHATQFSIGPGKFTVIGITFFALVFCIWQAGSLKIGDSTPGSPLLWPDHPFNQNMGLLDRTFDASSEDFVLYFEGEKGSVYDPAVFNTFEAFDRYLKLKLPDIYKSSDSFMGMMKLMNLSMHDGDMVWRELPFDPKTMTGLIGWARQQTDIYTQRRYFDEQMKMTHITISFSDHTSVNLLRIRKAVNDFFETHPIKIEKGQFRLAGGRIGMEIAVNEEMKRTHAVIDTMVLVTIFILCAIFYRSIIAGLMFTLPLILGNMMAFAYMAMTNIGLSINTLPVAAVGVGVGVDFAIYIYNRCIEEYPKHGNWVDTIVKSVQTSGKAVVFTGLTMVLPILVLVFSYISLINLPPMLVWDFIRSNSSLVRRPGL